MNPCTKRRHPEEWRPIPGSRYQASSWGRIRSPHRILKNQADDRGREYVKVDGGKARKVAHLVLEAFHGPRPEGMEACHWDDDPAHNCPDNLRWDTKASNMDDRARNGGNAESLKTHCPQGHPYAGDNLSVWKNGRQRVCKTCHNARERARLARKRERQ
jgi:hypothetical protein